MKRFYTEKKKSLQWPCGQINMGIATAESFMGKESETPEAAEDTLDHRLQGAQEKKCVVLMVIRGRREKKLLCVFVCEEGQWKEILVLF